MAEGPEQIIPEDAIRIRSYLIWQHEGYPEGRALDHWLRAKAELEAEFRDPRFRRKATSFVVPRPSISTPPCRNISAKIDPRKKLSAPAPTEAAAINAAKR